LNCIARIAVVAEDVEGFEEGVEVECEGVSVVTRADRELFESVVEVVEDVVVLSDFATD
jgi:hypothetical protein